MNQSEGIGDRLDEYRRVRRAFDAEIEKLSVGGHALKGATGDLAPIVEAMWTASLQSKKLEADALALHQALFGRPEAQQFVRHAAGAAGLAERPSLDQSEEIADWSERLLRDLPAESRRDVEPILGRAIAMALNGRIFSAEKVLLRLRLLLGWEKHDAYVEENRGIDGTTG